MFEQAVRRVVRIESWENHSDLFDSVELKPRTGRFSERHVIVRDRDFIDRFLERCLNLYSLAIAETVFAAGFADRDQPVAGEFPNDRVRIGRRPPFTHDVSGRAAASGQRR